MNWQALGSGRVVLIIFVVACIPAAGAALISPPLGTVVLVLAIIGLAYRVMQTDVASACPHCRRRVDLDAAVCPHCGLSVR